MSSNKNKSIAIDQAILILWDSGDDMINKSENDETCYGDYSHNSDSNSDSNEFLDFCLEAEPSTVQPFILKKGKDSVKKAYYIQA